MNSEVGIYSFGYWGWGNKVPELQERFLKFNKDTRGRGIVWVDIRVRRAARAEGFRGTNPEQLFGKNNYVWISEFGNKNIISGTPGIEIKDYDGGFRRFLGVVEQASKNSSDLILFCACKPDTGCHRHTVMEWLGEREIKGAKVYDEFPAENPAVKTKPNDEFLEPVQPNEKLAVIVGKEPMTCTELTHKLWDYIVRNGLQDKKVKTKVNADAALQAVLGGKKSVDLFEMTVLVSENLE